MVIKKNSAKVRCDFGRCKNIADFSIVHNGLSMFHAMHICKMCMNELYEIIGENIVPKSPPNPIQKSMRKASIRLADVQSLMDNSADLATQCGCERSKRGCEHLCEHESGGVAVSVDDKISHDSTTESCAPVHEKKKAAEQSSKKSTRGAGKSLSSKNFSKKKVLRKGSEHGQK